MVTGGNKEKWIRTLLVLNFVLKYWRKFNEEQDKNDWGSDQGKTCFVFCGALISPTLLATPTLNLKNSKSFWQSCVLYT